MKKISARDERAVRIELARARAAVERERLGRNLHDAAHELSPARMVSHFLPSLGFRHGPLAWLRNGAGRYPLLMSIMSAVISGGSGRRRRWWRLGAVLLAGVEVAHLFSRSRD